jgi:hypothetical protein
MGNKEDQTDSGAEFSASSDPDGAAGAGDDVALKDDVEGAADVEEIQPADDDVEELETLSE